MSEPTPKPQAEAFPTQTNPLVSDPRRQACHIIRGYFYQIWVSVHTWLELKEGEVLYLESAEDIDRLHAAGAEVIQVKDQAANITLRSAPVVDAIGNYWTLRKKNPGKSIEFRFLTTAEAGIEDGEPFGTGVKGIDLWQQSRRDAPSAKRLVDFLVQHPALPKEVTDFLRDSDIAEAQKCLLAPITWELGARDASYVATEVDRRLASLGETFGIMPEQSKRASAAFLRAALENASARERRPLTHEDARTIFENQTTQRVTQDEYRTLRILQQRLTAGLLPATGSTADVHLQIASRIQPVIPPLPAMLHTRRSLVNACRQILDRTGLLVLTGSVGMGKTTLAKLIAAEGGEWVWVHLSKLPPDIIQSALDRIGLLLDATPTAKNILFDDIDLSPAACRLYEPSLGGILVTAMARSGRVILTSQRSPSQRLQSALTMENNSLVQVPALTEEEIRAILMAAGFPRSQAECLQRAKIIWFQTSGHPQLVQAATRSQLLANWPNAKIEALIETPEEIKAEKIEARQILVDALSSTQRTLAYWLSTAGLFRRDHAIAIGHRAGIPSPGDDFDVLVGPWVEPISESLFRVTPLIGAAANDALGQDQLRQVHSGIADAILSCGHLTQHEASSVMMHALVGKNARILFLGAHKMIMGADEPTRDVVLRELSWFLALSTESGRLIYPDDPQVNSALRMLQFRIALVVDTSKAELIAQRWDEEIRDCRPRELYLIQRFNYVLHLLMFFQAPIRPARLIACFKELDELRQAWPELAEKLASLKFPATGDFPITQPTDAATLFFGFTAARCDGPAFLSELMTELETVSADLRTRMLSSVIDSTSAATMLIDRTWLAVARHEKPDWNPCVAAFQDARAKATTMGLRNLAHAATRALAIIYDEYLDSPQRAIEELDTIQASTGSSPILEDERATILYHRKEYGRALEIWQKVLSEIGSEPNDYDFTIWTTRKAGISAAMTGDWALAATLFTNGSERARRTGVGWATAGLLADAAYAHWKAEQYPLLVEKLRKSLMALETLPDAKHEFSTFSLGKQIGCVLVWIKNELCQERNPNRAEPFAGMCSNPEPNERLRELPMTIPEICWIMLADAEFELAVGTEVYDEVRRRFNDSPRAASQILLRSLKISRSTRAGAYADIPNQAFRLVRTLTCARATMVQGAPFENMIPPDAFSQAMSGDEACVVAHTLCTALICAAARGHAKTAIQAWKANVGEDPSLAALGVFVAAAESALGLNLATARARMRQTEADWQARTMAALRLTLDEDTTPEDIFQAHMFLLGCIRSSAAKREAANNLAVLVERNWRHLLRFPVQLRAPMMTSPAISEACSSRAAGITKIARILIAASPAIRTPVPEDVLRDLETLASTNRY